MLALELRKDFGQFVDEFLLLILLAEHRGHLTLEVTDDEGVHLRCYEEITEVYGEFVVNL